MTGPVRLNRIDLRQATPTRAELRATMPRGGVDVDAVLGAVQPVVDDVRARGVEAAMELSERFDGVRPQSVRVPRAARTAALAGLDPAVRGALETAIDHARIVHGAQRRTDNTVTVVPGGTVTEKWIPVDRVGLYVPGGNAVYPSSVVMNVVPAQEAGVDSLVVCSPPQVDHGGLPHPTILAAAELLGVDEVWAVGGAQAVALMAHGGTDTAAVDDFTADLDPVDMVTGPGNIYVTAAKRLCRATVGIDAEAGPTEVAILADDTADPVHVAADMISQAEHDVMAAAVLVTDSVGLADAVDDAITAQLAGTTHVERVRESLSGPQSGTVLVRDLDQGLEVVDAYAAEHLEVQTADAAAVAARVTAAGAIFVGPYAPVSLGDYVAGSNHVLPTSGSARFSSGLSVQTFLKGVHVVEYDREALAGVEAAAVALAEAEDLPSHGRAVRLRFDPQA